MKKINLLLVSILSIPCIVQAQTAQQWQQCSDKVGRSIDIAEVGNIGYEQQIKAKCGTPPITPIAANKLEGSLPYEVVQAAPWKAKFQKLTGKGYDNVKVSLTVSSAMQREGDWVIGSGYDPSGGGVSKAVIAINLKTNKVLAVYADAVGEIEFYGFDANSKGIPEKLWQWVSEETGVG